MEKTKTALIVLDLENDLVHPEGKLARSAKMVVENAVIAKANTAIQWARRSQALVIFVRVGFSANYIECSTTSPLFSYVRQAQALQLNTWGTAFDEHLDVREEDIILLKHRVGAFYATSLQAILTARQIQEVVLCGVSTDFAVQTTAREAHDRDYCVTIVQDACATHSIEDHRNTIQLLERFCTVVNSDALSAL